MRILARFAPAYTLGMTVAALIIADDSSLVGDRPSPALSRLIEAAWSGGAHPILVSGLTGAVDLAPLALHTEAGTAEAAGAEALRLVGGTTALLSLPVTHLRGRYASPRWRSSPLATLPLARGSNAVTRRPSRHQTEGFV